MTYAMPEPVVAQPLALAAPAMSYGAVGAIGAPMMHGAIGANMMSYGAVAAPAMMNGAVMSYGAVGAPMMHGAIGANVMSYGVANGLAALPCAL